MARPKLKLVIGTPSGPRSATWRIYPTGDEVYVESPYTGGKIKTSLHRTGVFRHAFQGKDAQQWIGQGDTAFHEWRETAPSGGLRPPAVEIIAPTDELDVAPQDADDVTFLAPAPPGHATHISIYFSPPDSEHRTGRTKLGALEVEMIANWQLRSRGRLWVAVSRQPLDAAAPGQIAEIRATAASESAGKTPPPGPDSHRRLIVFQHSDAENVERIFDLRSPL